MSESFESGESIADEPKIDDYDNRWDTDLSYQSYSKTTDSDSIDPGSVVEQTLSEKISLKINFTNKLNLNLMIKHKKILQNY